MNRLQKKCVIATAGFHLLLLVILFVGPAFFWAREKPDDSHLLDAIPANLVDAALNSGVKDATPPAQAPVVTPPPPAPPAPKPIVQPAPTPTPTLTERVEKFFKPAPEKPTPAPIEDQPHTPKVNLTPVTHNVTKNPTPAKTKDNSQAIKSALVNLKHSLSSPTEVNVPGDSSAAYANYASAVKSIYDAAWALPDSIANADENIKVSVTIARDGTVISSHIITPSGDATADGSVQKTLDRVQFVAPFPEGSTDKERTFIIIFNPQVKSSE
jgi:TonB family protein